MREGLGPHAPPPLPPPPSALPFTPTPQLLRHCNYTQIRIENPVKQLISFQSLSIFVKAPTQMSDRVLNMPLIYNWSAVLKTELD